MRHGAFLLFDFFDFRFGRILLNAVNAVFAAVKRFVAFGGSDDLTVSCLQAETVFAVFALIDFKLGVEALFEAFNSLIFNIGDGCVYANGLDAVYAGRLGFIDFTGCDGFAVACEEMEIVAGVGFLEFELAHGNAS